MLLALRPVVPRHVVLVAITAVAASGVDGAGVHGGLASVGARETPIIMGSDAVGCGLELGTMGIG